MRGLLRRCHGRSRARARRAPSRTSRCISMSNRPQLPGPQPRRLRRRLGAHRSARGPAGHSVRIGRRGRRAALHHQQAEARCHRGRVNAAYGTPRRRKPEHAMRDAMLNLPLIPDTLAVRAVVYNDSRGGYINNVPSTFSATAATTGLALYNGGTPTSARSRPGRAAQQRVDQQQQHRRQRHQSRHLPGSSRRRCCGKSTRTGMRCSPRATRT